MNASIYLFSGENEYFKKQRVDKLVNEFVEQSAYSLDKDLLYSGETDVSTILNKPEIPIAIGWLKKNDWVTIKKEKGIILEITDNGKKALKILGDHYLESYLLK